MAQWIRRLPTEQEILGSSPSTDFVLKKFGMFLHTSNQSTGIPCYLFFFM